MSRMQIKKFTSPDESRQFPSGHAEIVRLDERTIGKAVFEPGWRWSEHVKPLAGTESCQAEHTGYVISGRMKVVMNDGTEGEIGPGDMVAVPPGHDAWVVGNEPCVLVDFTGMSGYAQPGRAAQQQVGHAAAVPRSIH